MSTDPALAPKSSNARQELISIQREIVARLKNDIHAQVGGLPPAVQVYYDEYWREISQFERVSSWQELMATCARADLIYCGDYHTLRNAQETAERLICELVKSGREVVVALELVPAIHQHHLDAFMRRKMTERAFLKAIDYDNAWAFPWAPYRKLLRTCRRLGLRLVAINSEPDDFAPDRVIERDMHAAQIIVGETVANPNALLFVLDGDLHVVTDHLPLIVTSMLNDHAQQPRRQVVVHQNAEPIYWQLAEEGLERLVDVVRIDRDCYCVFSATPLVALQSYLLWQEDHAELTDMTAPFWQQNRVNPNGVVERVHQIVETLSRFLEIEHEGLDNFEVFTTCDLDFLEVLHTNPQFTPAMIEEIRRHVRASESYFIPIANIVYLADLSLFRAAEEATHFLNCLVAGFSFEPRTIRDAFYYQAMREALGFFGSRMIDPRRHCVTEEDFLVFLQEARGRCLDEVDSQVRDLAKLVVRHLEAERYAHAGKSGGPRRGSLFSKPLTLLSALAHAIGYILGDKLYNAVMNGVVSRGEVRELFADPLPPDRSERAYFAWTKRLANIEDRWPSQAAENT